MQCTFKIYMATTLTLETDIIHISLIGEVTREDLQDLICKIAELEKGLERAPDRLVMISEDVVTLLRYEAIEEFAAKRNELCYKNSVKTAMVARRPLQVGYSRMIQSLNSNPQIKIEIFSTKDAALSWLKAAVDRPIFRSETLLASF